MFAACNRCKRELRPGVRQPLSLPIRPAGPPYESKSVEYFEIGGHIGLAPVFCAHSNPRDHDDAAPATRAKQFAANHLIDRCAFRISTVLSMGSTSTGCPFPFIVVARSIELYMASSVASITARRQRRHRIIGQQFDMLRKLLV